MMMENPFQDQKYSDDLDYQLVNASLGGSKEALEKLIRKHQDFVYNIVYKMIVNPADAQDITQEILIKVITKLSQFEGKSLFRTWLYRIVCNHVLRMKRHFLEEMVVSFEQYGNELDRIPDQELSEIEKMERQDLVEEAKLSCMAGMLLCLNREQRITYILGELFEVNHLLVAEILQISPDNFRQRLSRARKDLSQFMHNKCGLINHQNPCRCSKKTKSFIEAGWVDSKQLKFNTAYTQKIKQILPEKSNQLCDLEDQYGNLFKDHPFQQKEHLVNFIKNLLEKTDFKQLFAL